MGNFPACLKSQSISGLSSQHVVILGRSARKAEWFVEGNSSRGQRLQRVDTMIWHVKLCRIKKGRVGRVFRCSRFRLAAEARFSVASMIDMPALRRRLIGRDGQRRST